MHPRLTRTLACCAIVAFTSTAATINVGAGGRPPVPATASPTTGTADPAVQRTLQALARLHALGYTINTSQRADRAIRHWQKVNGLVVDGIVGPQTLGSLGLSATATVPATRLNPPAPHSPVGGDVDPCGGDVECIIRAVWPDDSEDWAVRIATRESRLVPNVRNACCWGLFQIHWKAHQAWLTSDYGITSPEQLYDPTINATVAYALYQQAGCQPWGC